MKTLYLLINLVVIFGCGSATLEPVINSNPNSVILFIGDGMGEMHRLAARWSAVGEEGKLSMDQLSIKGWTKTGSADNLVTDSAAAATAMASGVKTNNGFLGMDPDFNIVATILEEAKYRGKLVGLVTTTQISHATPAAFAAHIADRNLMTDIAEQLISAEVNVILGGGENEFLPAGEVGCFPAAGKRTDGRNLIDDALSNGYRFVCDPTEFSAVGAKSTVNLLGIFADEGMVRPFSPTLAEMTQKAIDILSQSVNGFFLMIESGQIDWASHSNDAENTISDTIELDKAVTIAIDYAAKNKNTLVIVTADHETGGMSVSLTSSGTAKEDGPFSMPDGTEFYVNWTTMNHTSSDVPTTSMGPSSDELAGIHDNTDIFNAMLQVIE